MRFKGVPVGMLLDRHNQILGIVYRNADKFDYYHYAAGTKPIAPTLVEDSINSISVAVAHLYENSYVPF